MIPLPLGGLMHPYQYSSTDKYPNPIQTGKPDPPRPHRKVWPPIVAFLLVSAVAVGAVIIGYRHIRQDAERAAAAEAAAAALAPTEDECVEVLMSFEVWTEEDPHLTLDQTRQLTVEAAAAVLAAGQDLAAGLAILPPAKGVELRAAVDDYVTALKELRAALPTGQLTDQRAEAVWSARSVVYDQRNEFNRFCI